MIEAKGPAGRVALAYFERVRAADAAGLVSLFAPGALVIMLEGLRIEGREAISATYGKILSGPRLNPRVLRLTEDGDTCAAEILASRPAGGDLPVVDVFQLGADGLIAEVRMYRQGA
jgi:ketosteroid isomerase-like protein